MISLIEIGNGLMSSIRPKTRINKENKLITFKFSDKNSEVFGKTIKHASIGRTIQNPPPNAIFPLWTFLIPSGVSTIPNLLDIEQIKKQHKIVNKIENIKIVNNKDTLSMTVFVTYNLNIKNP
mgnify:CR=1 FL=1